MAEAERHDAASREPQDRFDTRRLPGRLAEGLARDRRSPLPDWKRGSLADGVPPCGDPAADRAP